jgi:polar amino acid transport system substrate-binding protein
VPARHALVTPDLAGAPPAIFIPSLRTSTAAPLHNPRVTIPRRAGLLAPALLAVALLTAACAPADQPGGAAPSSAGAASATTAACAPGALQTLTPGTLTVGTDQPVYQPWYVDDAPENGKGFESAVAYAIADGLGYPKDKVTWTRVPFNAAIQPGPKSFDLNLTEFSITDERRQAVDFSAPYYDVKQAVVALSDNRYAGVTDVAGLKDARLGAQVGTTSYDAIGTTIKPTTPPAVFNTNDDAKLALSNGQVDAIVVDLPTAFFITGAELQNGKIVGQLPAAGTPEQFGAVLDKGSALTACVSEAVERLRSAGTLSALEQQWLTSAGSAPELR